MERKYRQKGYQDEAKDQPKTKERAKSEPGYGPRPSPRIETRFMEIMRCANCSAAIENIGEITFTDQCKKCGADLHSCKNCRYFDPGARFECQKPIESRIAKKADRNMCMQFTPKIAVEKQQPRETKKEANVSSARKAFDDLFKK
ncbi:MAG: hypothetical protein AB1489_07930 [Acidobacteriota bacterium]